jgi:hypothetical protein
MNMKAIACVAFALFLLGAVAAAAAKTTSKTIAVSAQIVPGNTVSAYLSGGEVHTIVARNGAPNVLAGAGAPIIRIGFDTPSSWYLVKRVAWDKHRNSLTIDF